MYYQPEVVGIDRLMEYEILKNDTFITKYPDKEYPLEGNA